MPHYKCGKSMMMVVCYKGGIDDKSNNNKDKICLLLKNEVGGLRVRLYTRLRVRSLVWTHDYRSYNHGVT